MICEEVPGVICGAFSLDTEAHGGTENTEC